MNTGCNYTKCELPSCPPGNTPVRNVTVQKCCCPQYDCVPEPPKEHYCMIDGVRKTVGLISSCSTRILVEERKSNHHIAKIECYLV